MSKLQFCIAAAVVGIGIVLATGLQYRSQSRLRQENTALRQQTALLTRVSAENSRLSNLLAQVRSAQGHARDQYEELVRLRAEVLQFRQGTESQVATAQIRAQEQQELAALRAEVDRLSRENESIEGLRDEIRELRAAVTTPPAEEASESAAAETEERTLSLRTIATQSESFAEKLKRSVAATDNESFQQVFGRFLQVNGVQTNGVAAAVFDQRTGRVIVRGTDAALDQVERLTRALDQEP